MPITIDGDGTITGLSAGGLPNNSVQTADIADDQITLAKMAGGTDGQIITYDASGNPTAVGPGTDGQVLTSTGAGSPPAFEALPASGATLDHSSVNTSSATATLTFGTNGNLLSTSTQRWTIAYAGLSASHDMTYGRIQLGYGATPTYHTGTDAYSPAYYMHARNGPSIDGSHNVGHNDGFSFIANVENDYHIFNGFVQGQHLTGNKWLMQSDFIVKTNNEHPKLHRSVCITTALSSAITSVRLIVDGSSEQWNAGELSYVGIVS